MLAVLGGLLALASGIASLVFFIMVVMEMFKRDQKNLGIICIVLTFCTGVGPLIAFIFGWMKATEWDLKKTMTYWTVSFLVYFVGIALIVASTLMTAASMDPSEFDIDPNNMDFNFEIDESEFDIPEFEMPNEAGTESAIEFDSTPEAANE